MEDDNKYFQSFAEKYYNDICIIITGIDKSVFILKDIDQIFIYFVDRHTRIY